MNSKVTNKVKLVILLRQSWVTSCISICPRRSLLAPLYRWPGLRILVRFNTNSSLMAVYIEVSLFEYIILRLLTWAIISVGLNPIIHQGYQCHGPWQAYPCQRSSRAPATTATPARPGAASLASVTGRSTAAPTHRSPHEHHARELPHHLWQRPAATVAEAGGSSGGWE
jgi:hypothetical protein